ncbi:hypothetical protein PIB30_068992 [Stylosanthes scabra]|uniref:Uncharacterized protein n=1 Tax=Stylosanthes scabra TaxID=79078 RepID=A0ABU6SN84_9FABA|nr:hypothetical protein [Stylosanthes scabra]
MKTNCIEKVKYSCSTTQIASCELYLALRPHHCDRLFPASALPKTALQYTATRALMRRFSLCAWASRARAPSTRQASSTSRRVCNPGTPDPVHPGPTRFIRP